MDEPEYFSEGSFMTYDNGVRKFITDLEATFTDGHMADFHKHMVAAAYQMTAFQHASAIAECVSHPYAVYPPMIVN